MYGTSPLTMQIITFVELENDSKAIVVKVDLSVTFLFTNMK